MMELKKSEIKARGIRFSIRNDKEEAARAFLYILRNELHLRPFGLLEDVFVKEEKRGRGFGTRIIQAVLEEARKQGCYKLIATSRESRPRIHKIYTQLGFERWGYEFRFNLESEGRAK